MQAGYEEKKIVIQKPTIQLAYDNFIIFLS